MSNENERRDQDLNKFLGPDGKRTLKPVERSLYRHVFMAAIEDRAAPDAAHRDGMNAVRLWNEVGAFNEERPPIDPESSLRRAADLYDALRTYVSDPNVRPIGNEAATVVMCFVDGDFDTTELRRRLGLSTSSSG